jgi:hypothetical protein
MEIGKINAGAWLTIEPVDARIGEIKLRLLPIPSDFKFPEGKDVTVMQQLDAIGSLIVGWNLEDEGVAVPCDEENKHHYLPYLIRLQTGKTLDEKGVEKPKFAAEDIIKFAADIDNFLGN